MKPPPRDTSELNCFDVMFLAADMSALRAGFAHAFVYFNEYGIDDSPRIECRAVARRHLHHNSAVCRQRDVGAFLH